MNYAIEMGSCAMICIPSFIWIGSGIQELLGQNTQTDRQQGDLISLLSFYQNTESGLKIPEDVITTNFDITSTCTDLKKKQHNLFLCSSQFSLS
jgi:hypothetical protein